MNRYLLLLTIIFFSYTALAQSDEGVSFPVLGHVEPRHSNEIASSNWAIGGETMDRDYSTYSEWKEHLGPLGAKKIRLQAGWAKCEPEKGVYNFQWLDEIIDDVIAQGLEPWLQTSYGNPIYEGGGNIFLSGGFPTSHEALEAWDNWVTQLAKRYSGRVKIWEIWNESDLNVDNTPDAYSKLFVRTAEIIRSEIPNATIYALSLAGVGNTAYVKTFLEDLKKKGKLDLVDEITLHGYTYRPEDTYKAYYKMTRLVQSFSDKILINQGELGCPSENQPQYALRNYDWTEMSQSKWMLRKLLGDLGHDFNSLYFTIIDLNYIKRYRREKGKVIEIDEPIYTVNTKGLIKAKADNSVDYLKPSYKAYQNITSIFDHSLTRIPNYAYRTNSNQSLSVYGYQVKNFDYQVVTIWEDADTPNNSTAKTSINFEFANGNFTDPVYVDMRTGKIYEIPESNWKKTGTNYSFKGIPIYDSPVLIAEKDLVFQKKNELPEVSRH